MTPSLDRIVDAQYWGQHGFPHEEMRELRQTKAVLSILFGCSRVENTLQRCRVTRSCGPAPRESRSNSLAASRPQSAPSCTWIRLNTESIGRSSSRGWVRRTCVGWKGDSPRFQGSWSMSSARRTRRTSWKTLLRSTLSVCSANCLASHGRRNSRFSGWPS